MADIAESPQLKERGFFVEFPHLVVGTLRYPGAPFQMSESPGRNGLELAGGGGGLARAVVPPALDLSAGRQAQAMGRSGRNGLELTWRYVELAQFVVSPANNTTTGSDG